MPNRLSVIWIAILALGVLAASEAPAHAYIDPSTGSYLLQLAIGSILGGLFVLRMYWKKVTAPFRRKRTDEDGDDEELPVPKQAIAAGPRSEPARKPYVGRTCPLCRFPLKAQQEMTVCPDCGVAHHADCWRDTQGCTTYACTYSPGSHPPDSGGTAPAGS